MTHKSYADLCIERAEKASEGPWETNGATVNGMYCLNIPDADFIAHSRTDVPELARRLQAVCKFLKKLDQRYLFNFEKMIDELEAMPEEK